MVKLICAVLFCVLWSGSLSQAIIVDDGLEAFNGDFPWVAYIEPLDLETLNPHADCLGSLISSTWVFTTARCNVYIENNEHIFINGLFRVYMGSVNVSESSVVMASLKFVTHPDFDVLRNLNNAALIELPSPVTFSDEISPISLPWSIWNLELSGTHAFVVGRRFGFQSVENGDDHAIIRWNNLNIISNEACDVMSGFMRVDTDMCAFGITSNPTKTPCNSNGFLTIYTDQGFVLVSGSGAVGECHSGLPNHYPRVSFALDFIRSVTGLGADQ